MQQFEEMRKTNGYQIHQLADKNAYYQPEEHDSLKREQRIVTNQSLGTNNSNTSINAFAERKNENVSPY